MPWLQTILVFKRPKILVIKQGLAIKNVILNGNKLRYHGSLQSAGIIGISCLAKKNAAAAFPVE